MFPKMINNRKTMADLMAQWRWKKRLVISDFILIWCATGTSLLPDLVFWYVSMRLQWHGFKQAVASTENKHTQWDGADSISAHEISLLFTNITMTTAGLVQTCSVRATSWGPPSHTAHRAHCRYVLETTKGCCGARFVVFVQRCSTSLGGQKMQQRADVTGKTWRRKERWWKNSFAFCAHSLQL